MPNTFTVTFYVVGEQGVTATRVPQGVEAVAVYEKLNDFSLLKTLVDYVDTDFAMMAPASIQVNSALSLFQQCLTTDEFTIYPVKKYNANPKWVCVVQKESAGK